MRTMADRLRHAILFEIFGLVLVVLFGPLLFGISVEHMGVVAIISIIVAAGWNYIYNLVFDMMLKHYQHSVHKKLWQRIIHAVLFELGLLVILQPLIAYYLGQSMFGTLWLTFSLAVFYMVYGFVYNLIYDRVFPVVE
ncbi:hypothetical protein LMG33818_002026 [Halomonadaceae bacterium LMG 33818]|uniref:PACE efflux transporter n=1 Tax=Cernens ardua TaxID=3402176 RepID=UPI003EDC0E6B